MTKSASLSIGLMLLVGFATAGFAQSPATDTAIKEAIKRQADTIQLRNKRDEARSAEARKDLPAAAKLYEDAWKLAEGIGNPESPEAKATVAGVAAVQLDLARDAQKRGDLLEAKQRVTHVLKVDPKNGAAITFQKEVERQLAEQKGTIPSLEAQERIPVVQNEKIDAATKVQDGRLFLEMGKLDEAEKVLIEARKIDPEN